MQEKEIKQCSCKICGKKISNTAIYCLDCLKIQRRKVERPSRQELKDMIRELPFTVIGERYGISDNAIRKWCEQEKLPRTKKEINSYSDVDWKEI